MYDYIFVTRCMDESYSVTIKMKARIKFNTKCIKKIYTFVIRQLTYQLLVAFYDQERSYKIKGAQEVHVSVKPEGKFCI